MAHAVHLGTRMTPKARVLVADDEPDYLQSVAVALERLGLEVVRASSGDELITKIAEHGPFAVIVTDVSMPWMSGLQAMQSARYAGLVTPLIVMTAMKDDRIDAQVKALGHSALLLRKPFALDKLESAVMQFVRPANQTPSPRTARTA